jgi:iron complex transport system ATP-binding protein
MTDVADSANLLEARGLAIDIGSVKVVENLTFGVRRGEFWGVLGPNGVGKTTLLKALAGLHAPRQGGVFIDGQSISSHPRRMIARKLGMLSQSTRYAFEASCEETALIGRHPYLSAWSTESESDRQLARQALADLNLLALADRSCMQLSGGESRRLALATLLVQDPDILLLDEPINHLDPANQITMLNVLARRVRENNKGAVMALHEVNLAACYCTHIMLLYGDNRWAAGSTEDLLTEENLSTLYGCRMRLVDDGLQRVFAVSGSP